MSFFGSILILLTMFVLNAGADSSIGSHQGNSVKLLELENESKQGDRILTGKRISQDAYTDTGNDLKISLSGTFKIPTNTITPTLFIPYMGGKVKIRLNGKEIYSFISHDKTTEGLLLPIPIADSLTIQTIKFEFTCRQTTFCGFWRGVPEIGEFQTLREKQEEEFRQEFVTPFISSLLLFITALTLVLLSFGLRKTKKANQFLAFFLFTWGLYFLSYSGFFRKIDGLFAAISHFPLRSVTALGLLLFIDSYFSAPTPKQIRRIAVVFFSFAIIAQSTLGYLNSSLLTLRISSLVNLLSFFPLLFVSAKKMNGIHKIAIVLAYFALLGQIRDSAMLFNGGVLFKTQTMYLNKYTLPPFVLLAFVDHLLNYVTLSLRDRLLQTHSKISGLFSIKAGQIFSKLELETLYSHFLERLNYSEKKVLRVFGNLEGANDNVSEQDDIIFRKSQQNVLAQILEANFCRIDEYDLRSQTERKISALVRQIDPNLFEYISKNIESISVENVSHEAERGIIFFDQKGYTTLLENLDELEAFRLAEIVNKWVSERTARYAARIRNFNGDAYTLELYPLPNEDVKMLCVRTCELVWDLSQSIDALNKELFSNKFEPIIFRFGAHVGRASGIKLDFINPGLSNIVGDNVNIAARLQTLARPGAVYVSGELASLCDANFVFRRIPRSFVKGRRREIQVHEVIGRLKDAIYESQAVSS